MSIDILLLVGAVVVVAELSPSASVVTTRASLSVPAKRRGDLREHRPAVGVPHPSPAAGSWLRAAPWGCRR